jgi:SAM-dependent methyltransferase
VFDYYRCSKCGAVSLAPIPADLGRYYPSEYYRLPDSLETLAALAESERYKLDIVVPLQTRGRLLDIGPSMGAFAHLAREAGFEVSTIERDPDCCRFLEGVVGVRAVQSEDPAAALRAEHEFDVITMWHVIEHLPNPWEVIAEATRKLRPGGLLVISAPNPESLQFRLFGRYWMHLDAPRHLQLIPLAEVVDRAASNGLRPALVSTQDQGTLECNPPGWKVSTAHWLTDQSIPVFRWKLGSALALLAKPIDRLGRLGSAYTVALTAPDR